jgi:glycine/serine hydroxymethyltransferase
MAEADMPVIAELIDRVLASNGDAAVTAKVRGEVREVCEKFEMPGVGGFARAGAK